MFLMMGLMLVAAVPPFSQVLPCSLSAGWELLRTLQLPRNGLDGRAVGGFSAAAYQAEQDRLWLLSDAPQIGIFDWFST